MTLDNNELGSGLTNGLFDISTTWRSKLSFIINNLGSVNGLLKRKVINDRPIAVSYELTKLGKSTLDILENLKDWSEVNKL